MALPVKSATSKAVTAGLAGRINAAHHRAESSMREAVEAAIECGELLTEAKSRIGHGGWGKWLQENFRASDRTARNYMRLAAHADEVNRQPVADLGVRAAIESLAKPKPETDRLIEEARQHLDTAEALEVASISDRWEMACLLWRAARETGFSHRELAEQMGLPVEEVTGHLRLWESLPGPPPRHLAELQAMLPDLTGEEWDRFKASIAEHGCRVAIELDEDGRIIDGRQRARACRELGIKPPTVIRPGLTEAEKFGLCWSLNVVRHHRAEDRVEP